MANDFVGFSRALIVPKALLPKPGESPKKNPPGLLPAAGEPMDPAGSCREMLFWHVGHCKKNKNTPQNPADEPAEPFVVLLILGRKRGLKNCEALRGPQWELDTALSFRINTKSIRPPQILIRGELVQSNPFLLLLH